MLAFAVDSSSDPARLLRLTLCIRMSACAREFREVNDRLSAAWVARAGRIILQTGTPPRRRAILEWIASNSAGIGSAEGRPENRSVRRRFTSRPAEKSWRIARLCWSPRLPRSYDGWAAYSFLVCWIPWFHHRCTRPYRLHLRTVVFRPWAALPSARRGRFVSEERKRGRSVLRALWVTSFAEAARL